MESGLQGMISSMLRTRWAYHVAAVVLTFIYWGSGIDKAIDFTKAQSDMARFGLNPAAAFGLATIAVQLGGSLLVILGGRLVWLGAGALAVFTLLTIPIAHRFWEMTGEAAFHEKLVVFEHITVIGGLMLVSIAAELGHHQSKN